VSNRFGIEPELTAKVARLGYRLYEVPISYHGREYWEGKKIGWKDGVAAIWTIVKHSLADHDDDAGFTTLQRLRHVGRYNEWVWSRMAPHVGDRVLEVGCGVGNFTRFLRDREHVVVTDNNELYLQRLRRALANVENVRVCNVDWGDPELDGLRGERFDTILCLNVLEHIEDDDAALATFARLLDPGGRLILQVPAMRALYGEIDRAIHHHRRYERHDLVAQLQGHGFVVEEASYFNLPGIFGWYVNSVLLKRRAIPGLQARIANFLVPWLHFEQKLQPNRGMSLLVVARKVRSE